MHKVRPQYYLTLGLLVLTTACSDPTQFNELPTGDEAIFVTNGETPKADETGQQPERTPEAKAFPDTYAGQETEPSADRDLEPENSSSQQAAVTEQQAAQTIFDDCEASPDKNIVAELFQLPDGTRNLPDFSSMNAIRTVCVSQLNIKDRQFTEGFPGVEGLVEWFGLDMRFQVEAPKSGTYEFSLISDDGAILWIDDTQVIDNDGLHAVTEKKNRFYLSQGSHSFHVAYYQGPRWRIALELYWKLPGSTSRSYIPLDAISRP